MPFKKGTPKPPTSGKKTGSRNKINSDARELLNSLGCNPLEGMAIIALDESVDMPIRVKCLAELAQYVYPRRRSVEHSGIAGEPIEFRNADSKKQSLEDRIAGIAERIRPNGITPGD